MAQRNKIIFLRDKKFFLGLPHNYVEIRVVDLFASWKHFYIKIFQKFVNFVLWISISEKQFLPN